MEDFKERVLKTQQDGCTFEPTEMWQHDQGLHRANPNKGPRAKVILHL